ncbi:hypothetical protein CU097_012308 [Rhizopus azygosporus]|uniref:HCP-like protein n=1 Tax=Rhizopus azygosporus TaxID=86630 RepID=A0A367K7F8_RHIAZ|nr:hypothetical protein CU097_012308 [Rhizopus azygosporus]
MTENNNNYKDEKTMVEEISLKKSRPLPKIPERVSSRDIPTLPLNKIENVIDSFKNQKRLTAQQIFQTINNDDDNDYEEEEECSGVYASKTEIPTSTYILPEPSFFFSKKLMTPVLEVDEEDEEYLTLPPTTTDHYIIPEHADISDQGEPSLESGRTSPSSSIDSTAQAQETREILDDISTLNLGSISSPPFPLQQQQHQQEEPYNKGPLQNSLLMDVQNLSQINHALMTPPFQPTTVKPENTYFMNSPIPTMTSFSLTHDKASIKTFRRMANKTHDPQTQFTYAKYLIQLVLFYSNNNQTNNEAISSVSSETRERLQEEAEYWIERLAKSNHPEALYIKGHWHRFGQQYHLIGSQYKRVNHSKAFKCFQQSAKLGCTEAHYELAEYYVSQKEYRKAITSYKYAASKNHTLALYKLANILLRGLLSQETDVHQGLAFLKQAADAGSNQDCARPAYDLACIYANDLESIDLEKNSILSSWITEQYYPLAIQYFKKADELGMAAAAFRLGKIYEHGQLGQVKSDEEAFKYYTRAAEKKSHEAMLELSRLYKDGIPGYLSPHALMAYKWCLYATENGNEVAEYTLGYVFVIIILILF